MTIQEVKKSMDEEVYNIQKQLHSLSKKYGQSIDCAELPGKDDDNLSYICAKQNFAIINAALAVLETY